MKVDSNNNDISFLNNEEKIEVGYLNYKVL